MYRVNGLIALSILGLTACGGGGSGSGGGNNPPTPTSVGVFKDSTVMGLNYESGEQKNVTNSSGEFTYEDDQDVTFSVGGVDLGTTKGKSLITPLDLVDGGTLSTTEVINRVRFLMMLDKDDTPSNGIEISSALQSKAKEWGAVDFSADPFSLEVLNIYSEVSGIDGSRPFPSEDEAIDHLRTTLLCANAGAYVGSYEGDEQGNLALMIDPASGDVSGSSYNSENQVSVEVKKSTELNDEMEFESSEDSGKKFSGKLNSSGAISGNWANALNETNGTFQGDRLGSSNNALYRYVVSFDGTDKGLFAFDVDESNEVTGTSFSVSTSEERDITGKIDITENLTDGILKAELSDGTKIDGPVNIEALTLQGSWSNPNAAGGPTAGTYIGSGCRLN